MSDAAVQLAREYLALAADVRRYEDRYADTTPDVQHALALAVIEQDEQIGKLLRERYLLREKLNELLPCPRCGRPDLTAENVIEHRRSCMSRTDDEYRIDELKAALSEALGVLETDPCGVDESAAQRIAELRRLLSSTHVQVQE